MGVGVNPVEVLAQVDPVLVVGGLTALSGSSSGSLRIMSSSAVSAMKRVSPCTGRYPSRTSVATARLPISMMGRHTARAATAAPALSTAVLTEARPIRLRAARSAEPARAPSGLSHVRSASRATTTRSTARTAVIALMRWGTR